MLSFVLFLAIAGISDAKPSGLFTSHRFSGIIGGTDASPGEFPWQLSQEKLGGSWSHSCGASLLSSTKVLSAAHCVDGAVPRILRVVAGLHKLSETTGSQTSGVSNFIMHEDYDNGAASSSNDVAIIHLETAITTGPTIQFASLPVNDNNNFAGTTCVISGWGRFSTANTASDTLQKADIGVITTAQCSIAMQGVGGAEVWDNHLCVQDSAGDSGACNGDSGGPLNCPSEISTVVAGVASWVVRNLQRHCLPAYPSVYTRTSAYLTWINDN